MTVMSNLSGTTRARSDAPLEHRPALDQNSNETIALAYHDCESLVSIRPSAGIAAKQALVLEVEDRVDEPFSSRYQRQPRFDLQPRVAGVTGVGDEVERQKLPREVTMQELYDGSDRSP